MKLVNLFDMLKVNLTSCRVRPTFYPEPDVITELIYHSINAENTRSTALVP